MMRRWVGMIATTSVLVVTPMPAWSQDAKLTVAGTQPIRDSLKSASGKKVSLRLTAGEELGGTVADVGDNAVRLTDLSGRELFEAVVRIDHITAVIVRAAKQ